MACQALTEDLENVDQLDLLDLPDFLDPEVQVDELEHPVDRAMQDDQELMEHQEPLHPEDPDQQEHLDHPDHPARTPVIIWYITVRMTEHLDAQRASTSYGRDIHLCIQLGMDRHVPRILENLDLVFRSSVPFHS